MWQKNGLPPPTKERKTVGSMKLMISVIWSASGIKSIVMLPRGASFNKEFFVDVVLGDLLKTIHTERPKRGCSELRLHIDNARPHLVDSFLEEIGLARMCHPPYSPDLAPSDFFLFGYLKTKLQGMHFTSDEELFQVACGILRAIPVTTLRDFYSEWIRRLKKCIELGGNFVE